MHQAQTHKQALEETLSQKVVHCFPAKKALLPSSSFTEVNNNTGFDCRDTKRPID